MLSMNKLQKYFVIMFLFSFFSCSNSSKGNDSDKITTPIEENSKTVNAIVIPPIEMKSLSETGEKNSPVQIKTNLGIPDKNENSIFPKDFSIGELGSGPVPFEAYVAARAFCKSLINSNVTVNNVQFLPEPEQKLISELILSINPNQVRLGSGQIEDTGRYSFLIRMLGFEHSASGVVYVQQKKSMWIIDDLTLEKDTKIEFNPLHYKHFL